MNEAWLSYSGDLDQATRTWSPRLWLDAPDGSGKFQVGFDVIFNQDGNQFTGMSMAAYLDSVMAHVEDGDFVCPSAGRR
jgi:hypothetical protein